MIKRKKQVLNVTVSEEIPSLDTAKTMDGTSAHIMQNIFEGLYALDLSRSADSSSSKIV